MDRGHHRFFSLVGSGPPNVQKPSCCINGLMRAVEFVSFVSIVSGQRPVKEPRLDLPCPKASVRPGEICSGAIAWADRWVNRTGKTRSLMTGASVAASKQEAGFRPVMEIDVLERWYVTTGRRRGLRPSAG